MNKAKAKQIIQNLSGIFTDKPALNFGTPYQLLVAVILSAQCTDERVNKVTANLFESYPTPEKLITLSQEQLEKYIFSCGLYKSKAKHILSATKDIIEKFGGNVPSDLESLQSLAGVGRKTANVVYSVAFGGQAIAVDTHVFRVSNRLGITDAKNVNESQKQLEAKIPREMWSDAHHWILLFGRYVCKSQNPNCQCCYLRQYCKFIEKRS